MRVVEAENLEATLAGAPHGLEVIARVDEKAVRTGRDVPRPERLDDVRVVPDEHPAALARTGSARVVDERREDASG